MLGGYRVLRRLGEGGMGIVYLARNTADQLVAVKVIKAQFAHDPEFAERFHREAQAASRVPAFCTARVLDAAADAEPPYLVTEFIVGPTLEAAVRTNGPLASSDLDGLAVGMAAALSAIHGANVIHRDLKPSNVLLSPVGPRVIDFGVARALEAMNTHSNLLIGTPAFMAPERFTGTGIGPATDIFAWGGVLAYASSGQPPFGDGDMATLMYRVIDHEPDLRGLTGDLRDLVQLAMRKEPAERPTSEQLLDALVGRTDHAPGHAGPTGTKVLDHASVLPAPSAGRRRARSVPWLTVALGVIALLAVGLLAREVLMRQQPAGTRAELTDAGAAEEEAEDAETAEADADGQEADQPAGTNDIDVGGRAVTVETTRPKQDTELRFAGEQGQLLSLGATNSTFDSATIHILDPEGTRIGSTTIYALAGDDVDDLDLERPLEHTGTYRIVVSPNNNAGSAELTLSRVPTRDAAIDGAPADLKFSRAGRDARLRFSAEQGQSLRLATPDSTIDVANVVVLDPNGEQVDQAVIFRNTGGEFEFAKPLPRSGEYTAVVDPDVATGTMSLSLSS
jgi:hypothetical protein